MTDIVYTAGRASLLYRPITRADAAACRCVAERLRAEGFPQGAQSITDRLAMVRQEVQRCPAIT